MNLVNRRLGLEQEFFLVNEEGILCDRADIFLARCQEIASSRGRPGKCFAAEFVTSIVEINTLVANNLPELTQEYLDLLQICLQVGRELNLRLYPLSTYPLHTNPVIRNQPNYHLQVRTVGPGRFDNAAKCTGTHVHWELPPGSVDRTVGIAYNCDPEARAELLNMYNLLTALDTALIALSRACPFYEGRVTGKAMRTVHYRGSEYFGWEGVYTYLQPVGGLLPYASTIEELVEILFNRYYTWLQAMDLAGVPRSMFVNSGGELLTAGWNPLRINKQGTLELRGMDSNYPEITLGLVALVVDTAYRVRREGLKVTPKSGIKTFVWNQTELYVPDFDCLNGELLYGAVTEGIESSIVKDYLDSVWEFASGAEEPSSLLDKFTTKLGKYATTETELLDKFATTTGEISREEGLRLVRYCCDELEKQVEFLSEQLNDESEK
ncbi:MAG: glutamate-cysteine ligase family protein [Oscillatoria sp. PMC 1068.18]|nr:glutamate-cysteine ligase family protein [Oscillatoria sp. PMC 1076.18]MEC4989737.1 glutamate-cysteine ligase family protein [Oscillatoria sp. PMC 1068.18]